MNAKGRLKAAVLAAVLVALANTAVSAAMTDEQKCLSGLATAKAKHELCVAKWLARAYAVGFPLPGSATERLWNCQVKYAAAWTRLQGLGTTCAAPSRWTDDGSTVTDHLTGLVWEKKTTAAGSGANPSDRHDVDNLYTWSAGPPYAESGTVYTDFLASLNAGGGFAGANGWRLPTVAELQTISLPEEFPCPQFPCTDPLFWPATGGGYWSSTSMANAVDGAFALQPNGAIPDGAKVLGWHVRAVRGGL